MPRMVLLALLALLVLAPSASAQLLPPLQPPGQPSEPDPEEPQEPPKPAPIPPGPVTAADGSVTASVDVANTGFFADEDVVPPLAPRWTAPVAASSVLAAGGRVYAISGSGLVALDLASGRELWRAANSGLSGAAYDAGRLFVSRFSDISAYDAASGAVLWTTKIAPVASLDDPVASGGAVYVTETQGSSNAELHALDAATGQTRWSAPTVIGAGPLALDGERVYVAGECASTAAHDRTSGAQAWAFKTGCTLGGDLAPALHGGRVWINAETGPVLDPLTGGITGHARVGGKRAFVDGLLVEPVDRKLTAFDLATGAPRWTSSAGGAPIAIGHNLYFHDEQGKVAAVAAEDGRVLWTSAKPAAGDTTSARPTAAAPGTLLTGGGQVTAWSSVYRPDPRAIAFDAAQDVLVGQDIAFGGVVGRELRAGAPQVTIEAATRGPFAPAGGVRLEPDGGYEGAIKATSNVRLRARIGGVTSAPITVYAEPAVTFGRFRVQRRARRAAVRVLVRAGGTALRGRPFVLYQIRAGTKRLDRVGSARLRRSGRGRLVAHVRFELLRRASSRDRLTWCIRGQAAVGFGRATPLNRRCGAARLKQ